MEWFTGLINTYDVLRYACYGILFFIIAKLLIRLVLWGKKMPKGAFIFLAFFPLISIFPIPPPVFKNVDTAKQEQKKKRENDGEKKD